MQDPPSPPKFTRTCPRCSRPVEPGNKFCATCGTMIPVLLTCSKCGTQFIESLKYCDLCGAPLIPGEIPKPDDSPVLSPEENTGAVEDQPSERDEAEIPGPDTGELWDDTDQGNIVPAKHKSPYHYKKEIQEPDTDELLEQYGKEYDEDETLESSHKPKSSPPKKHTAEKAVPIPAPPERGSSEAVDDALFLSPGKPEPSAKLRVNKTMIIGGCIVLIVVIAVIYFIGLPMLIEKGVFNASGNPPPPEPTIVETILPTLTGTPTPASRALVPLPTQLVPGQTLYFDVQKNPVTSKISVIFAGSAGSGSIMSADIKVTHPDGSVATGIILPLKGVSEITLNGSNKTDRVEIIAHMFDGKTYRVYDQLVTW